MNKSFLLVLIMLPVMAFSQITFEADYGHSGTFTKLANSGYKFYIMDVPAQQCRVYNLDHSLWKTIDLEVPVDQYLYDIRYVSENLFTDDNDLSLCYIYYSYDVNNQYYTYTANFIKDDGTSLLSVEGCQYVYVNTINDEAKMTLYVYNYSISPYSITTVIYDLPGQLVSNGEGSEFEAFSQMAYPNPANNYSMITYELPDGTDQGEIVLSNADGVQIQNYHVYRQFNDLMINTAQLPKGIYFYHLEAKGYKSEAKKIVVQ